MIRFLKMLCLASLCLLAISSTTISQPEYPIEGTSTYCMIEIGPFQDSTSAINEQDVILKSRDKKKLKAVVRSLEENNGQKQPSYALYIGLFDSLDDADTFMLEEKITSGMVNCNIPQDLIDELSNDKETATTDKL